MRELPTGKIYDAAAEFTRYLIVNAIVLVFALAVAFWPQRRQREIEDHEGQT
jgi:HAMP domain-containing protein